MKEYSWKMMKYSGRISDSPYCRVTHFCAFFFAFCNLSLGISRVAIQSCVHDLFCKTLLRATNARCYAFALCSCRDHVTHSHVCRSNRFLLFPRPGQARDLGRLIHNVHSVSCQETTHFPTKNFDCNGGQQLYSTCQN